MKIYQYPYSVKLASDMKINSYGDGGNWDRPSMLQRDSRKHCLDSNAESSSFHFPIRFGYVTLGKGKFLGNESETLESGRRQFAALQS